MNDEGKRKIFQERLRMRMEERGVTAPIVARRMRTTDKTIRNWLNGKSFPTSLNMRDLAQVLCVTVDYLLGVEEEK